MKLKPIELDGHPNQCFFFAMDVARAAGLTRTETLYYWIPREERYYDDSPVKRVCLTYQQAVLCLKKKREDCDKAIAAVEKAHIKYQQKLEGKTPKGKKDNKQALLQAFAQVQELLVEVLED